MVCNLLLLGSGRTPFWFAHWMLFALRSFVVRRGRNAILLCALEVVALADCCYSAGAYRHFGLRIGCCLLCGLLLPGGGVSPFWSAHWVLFALRSVVVRRGAYRHSTLRIGGCCSCRLLLLGWGGTPFWSALWTLLALRSVVARLWHIAILFCALEVICFTVCCCPAGGHIAILLCALEVVALADCCYSVGAERHFGLHIGCCLLRGLLLFGGGGTPFWSAHWTLLASRSVVARWWHIAILFCALEVICFVVCCCSVVAERLFHSAH